MVVWYYAVDGKPIGPHTDEDIESLFLTEQVDRGTLLWTKGMPQWTALGCTDVFRQLAEVDAPPPLPPIPTKSPFAIEEPHRPLDRDSEIVPAHEFSGPGSVSDISHWERPVAGPWSRYFARGLDLSLITTLIAQIAFVALPFVNMGLYFQLVKIDARALFILLLPVAHLVNAVIISAFGNSIGKAVFGIRAEPLAGGRFSILQNIRREIRVWTQGLALGIPLLNFFTMVPAYRRVAAGQQAPYDIGTAVVRSYSSSPVRRTLGMLLSIGVFAAIVAWNSIVATDLQQLQFPSTWTNPNTNISATIPAGWFNEKVAGPQGETLYSFTNNDTGLVALLGFESLPNAVDLVGYANVFRTALASDISLTSWSATSLPGVWRAWGTTTADGLPTTFNIGQRGIVFWRVVYVDQFNKVRRELDDPQLTTALLKSAGFTF